MSKDESNKNMCAYCRRRYFGCRTDEIRCYGICGRFIKDDKADMSDCYWTKHRGLYTAIKTVLWSLPALILGLLVCGFLLVLFAPVVFLTIVAVLAVIVIVVLVCVSTYLLFRFVTRSFDDVE